MKAKCPRCGKKSDTPHGAHDWYCHGCRQAFGEDDGSFGYGDPAKIVERLEQKPRDVKRPAYTRGKTTRRSPR